MSDGGTETLLMDAPIDDKVRNFSPAEDPNAAEQLAVAMGQSFATESANAFYCADPSQYELRWQIITRNCSLRNPHNRILYTMGPDFAAVAMAHLYPDEKAPEGASEPPGVVDLSAYTRPETVPVRASMFAFMDEKKAAFHQAHGTFLYLLFLGTRPSMRGKGYGSRLLRHLTDRADEAGRWCYLEATNNDNARLYERHGFRRLQEPWVWTLESLPGAAVTLIPMARAPAGQAAVAAGAE